jgi:hypothetical protein
MPTSDRAYIKLFLKACRFIHVPVAPIPGGQGGQRTPHFFGQGVKPLCQHPKIFSLASLANILDPPLFITYLSPCGSVYYIL